MHLPLARLVSMPVIFYQLPSSSIVILVFYYFLQASVNSMYENCECELGIFSVNRFSINRTETENGGQDGVMQNALRSSPVSYRNR